METNAGDEMRTDKGRSERSTTGGEKKSNETREGRDGRGGECKKYDKYERHDNNVWELWAPGNNEVGITERGAGRGTTRPDRDREVGARGLVIGARVHQTRSHEYSGVEGHGRSNTLETERALSKISGSTRRIKRRTKEKRAPHKKMGIYTHIQGIPTLSAEHNERVARS